MSIRYLWLMCFTFLGLGLACGGCGLYLVIAQVQGGYYWLIISVAPIMIGALFAALAFRTGMKGK